MIVKLLPRAYALRHNRFPSDAAGKIPSRDHGAGFFTLAWRIAALIMAALVLHPSSGWAAQQRPSLSAAISHRIDVSAMLGRLYAPDQPSFLWSDHTQAKQALSLLRAAHEHGLLPSHYDVDTLDNWLENLGPGDAGSFDKALSKAMLQLLADLHFGRIKPDFQLPEPAERLQHFDPVTQLRLALQRNRLPEAIEAAAPRIPLYQRVRATLQVYRHLVALEQPWTAPAPLPPRGELVAGKRYRGLGMVRQRLHLLGDLDAGAPVAEPDRYSDDLAQALKRFQSRHGLAETGYLGRDTLAGLGVPLSHRVRQLELTLERLRWMPALRPGRIIVVNVAAYRLWAYDTSDRSASEPFEMRVIVGKAARTPTPLFIGQMRYLEFNPYWNVPHSIVISEIIPKLTRDSAYLEKNGMELVSPSGQVQGRANVAAVAALRSGALQLRQTPGPHNVLGAVKFAMPNPMSIFLHSTSAKELFGKARRALSHGCIRVERPAALAGFVLADQPQWSAQSIEAAMAPGPTRTVRLGQTIPVVLLYATAATDRNGRALFADDIYRRDEKLIRAMQAR